MKRLKTIDYLGYKLNSQIITSSVKCNGLSSEMEKPYTVSWDNSVLSIPADAREEINTRTCQDIPSSPDKIFLNTCLSQPEQIRLALIMGWEKLKFIALTPSYREINSDLQTNPITGYNIQSNICRSLHFPSTKISSNFVLDTIMLLWKKKTISFIFFEKQECVEGHIFGFTKFVVIWLYNGIFFNQYRTVVTAWTTLLFKTM